MTVRRRHSEGEGTVSSRSQLNHEMTLTACKQTGLSAADRQIKRYGTELRNVSHFGVKLYPERLDMIYVFRLPVG
jgi:hypothetical protein